jgi:putative photosynthetic complex assembly protein
MGEIFVGQGAPKHLLHAGAAIVAVSLIFAGVARYTDFGSMRVKHAPVTESASLRFLDNQGGGVRVETEGGQTIAQFGVGEGGFLRGVMRGLARDRRSRDAGSDIGFELARRADGKITLTDPVSGRVIELDSFGPTNAGLFAGLLEKAGDKK